ncbi:MAG: DUF2958 domain-containing protein [Anaerolineae bacterium]|nr:DUF2958 domain-containing protein [Anaerolineae bacterium]
MAEDAAYNYIPAEIAASIPKLYKTADTPPRDKMIWIRLFDPQGSWTWYVVEYDGKDECFGYVEGFEGEWGYFTLSELRTLRGKMGLPIERDIWFKPQTCAEVFPEMFKLPEPKPEPAPAPMTEEELVQAIVQATAEIKAQAAAEAAAEEAPEDDFVVYEEPEEVPFVWPTQAGIVWKVDEVMLAREERMTVLEFIAA